ncbi:MAG: hypothetical protein IJ099_00150 [Alphaproteobacteria bacterium]|nr:hypothetical protein [Alphaproteobacteria bacterium]
MSSMLLIFLLFFLSGFIAMYLCFAPLARQYLRTLKFKPYMLPLLYIWLFYAIGSIGIYFVSDHNDFIEPLSAMRVILPLGLAVIIYGANILCSGFIFNAILAAAVVCLVLAQPAGPGIPLYGVPTWYIQLAVVVIGFVFCRFYIIMNSTLQTALIPLLMILLGVSMLSALGAAPMFSALCAAILLGILAAYMAINYNDVKIDLDDGSCISIAFLVFSLMVLQFGEFSFTSCLMFSAAFWAELIAAIWYRYVVIHAGSLSENTNYYVAATKYSTHILSMNILKISTISLFLGWFQLFSVNNYSLPFIAVLLILWLNHSFARTEADEPQKLRDINRSFVEDVKQNIKNAKEAIETVKKDK